MSNKKKKKDDTALIKEPIDNKKINISSVIAENFPIFCFRYLSDYSIKSCTKHQFFFDFLMRLQKLSELGWNEIRKSHRHSFGMEKVARSSIKPKLPKCITPDVESLDVFRATGGNHSFLGLQVQNIFRVFFIEAQFGDIYDH